MVARVSVQHCSERALAQFQLAIGREYNQATVSNFHLNRSTERTVDISKKGSLILHKPLETTQKVDKWLKTHSNPDASFTSDYSSEIDLQSESSYTEYCVV